MENLKESRKTLDEIDSKIILLLEERMNVAKGIGIYKLNHNLNTTDKNREKDIIENLESKINPEFKNIVMPIYKEIFSESKKIISKVKGKFSLWANRRKLIS